MNRGSDEEIRSLRLDRPVQGNQTFVSECNVLIIKAKASDTQHGRSIRTRNCGNSLKIRIIALVEDHFVYTSFRLLKGNINSSLYEEKLEILDSREFPLLTLLSPVTDALLLGEDVALAFTVSVTVVVFGGARVMLLCEMILLKETASS